MEEVAQLIAGAKHAVLFLAFYPGSPSVANWAAAAQKAEQGPVRARLRHPSVGRRVVLLRAARRGAAPEGRGGGRQDPRVIQAQALGDNIPAGWQKEIL